MLQLLQPSWLFALAGISIPVIIHLWNQRPGRILKVGSIALIPEETKEYKKSLQLSDLLLLLLRCLLIGAFAIVLANPVWKKPNDISKQKGWISIPRQNFSQTYSHFKSTVDSLYRAGFEFHYFAENFAKEKLETAIANQNDSIANHLSYWKLAESLDATLTSSIPVYIFTDNFLKHFPGSRPVLSFQPQWQTFTPEGINPAQAEKSDTSTLRISIFTDKYSSDARYIKAALDAIHSFSKRNIIITSASNKKQIPSQTDWLFWLSDLPLDFNINTKNIFQYAAGKSNSVASFINFNTGNASLPLYKMVADTTRNEDEVTWKDGFGNSVLSSSTQNEKNVYTFFSHFDPAWNEMVWNDKFPEIIYELLVVPKTNPLLISSNLLIDPHQLQPAYKSISARNNSTDSFERIDISGLSWLLVLILFFAERIVSFYNTKLKTNG